MEDLLEILDENIAYEEHEIIDDKIIIYISSIRNETQCPYCKELSSNVHSTATRTLKDLPIQSKKAILKLESKKYFCNNPDCNQTTYSERFDFFEPKATKTNRLQEEILRISLNQSSISASRYLRKSVADVGKSTICSNLLKKGHTKCG